VTDGSGNYKIVNLASGTYTLTFTLEGFSSQKRDGVELSGSFVATINADMKLGVISETVTVSGESPIVDVQSTKAEAVLNSSLLTALPTSRNYEGLHVLVPGVSLPAGSQDVGGANGAGLTHFTCAWRRCPRLARAGQRDERRRPAAERRTHNVCPERR